MLVGLGCDLLIKNRLITILQDAREQFLRRLCHPNELLIQQVKHDQELRYFCQLWSIKEACSKALGTGITGQTPLSSMEVSCRFHQAPAVILHDGAKQVLEDLMRQHHCVSFNILTSVSDEERLTMATVVIEIW